MDGITATTATAISATAVAYIGGYDDGCYVVRRVPTPFGFRLRTINVCD